MRFIKEVSSTLASRAAASLIGFGTSVIVARALQPEGKGILSTMTATADLAVALGTVGAGKSLTLLTAQDQVPRQELTSTACFMALVNGLLVGAVVLAAGPVLRGHVMASISWLAILAAAPLGVARVWATYGEGIARGLRQILLCNRALLAQGAAGLAAAVALLWLSRLTPVTALLALVAGALAGLFIYTRSILTSGLAPFPRLSMPIMKALLAYGAGYQAVGLLQMVHYRIDLFLVGHFGGADNAGWYSTASNLAQILWNVPIAVSFVIMPWVASKDEKRAGEGTAASARWTLWITLLLSLILGALAEVFIRTMYGRAFVPAAAPMRILLPGVVMNSLLLVLGGYLMGRGRTGTLTLIAAGSAVLNVGLNLFLIPAAGIRGAAASSTITYSLAALLVAWRVSRETGTPLVAFVAVRRDDIAQILSAVRTRP